MQSTMKKIEEIFRPGSLAEKQTQLSLFRAAGHSQLFSGDVRWKLVLPEEDKLLKGDAPSLDEAFDQLRAVMAQIAKATHADTAVSIAIEEKE